MRTTPHFFSTNSGAVIMVFIVLYKFRIKKVPILTIFSSEYLSLNIFSVIVNNISEYNITII